MVSWTLARHKRRKFQALSRTEQRLVIQALLILPVIVLGLRLFGLRCIQTLLTALAPLDAATPEAAPAELIHQAQTIAKCVKVAATHGPYRATCLPQALVVWWLLRRREIPSILRIGVRKDSGRFEAHAWVEQGGMALNDLDDVHQRFAPFDWTFAPEEAKT
jgi:hypothetical protein